MSTQYLRRLSLIVAPNSGNSALDLGQEHVQFWVKRGDLQTPNSLHAAIFNLSDETANRLRQDTPTPEFQRVVLQVGYEGLEGEQPSLSTIFDGNIKYVNKGNVDSKDSFVEIIGADGDSAYNFAFLNVSLAAGSTHSDHVNQYVQAMGQVKPEGITPGYIPTFTTPLPRGKVMFGPVKHYIRNTANTVECTWSIQDGQLQLLPVDGYLPGEAIELTSATGLVAFPTRTQSGIVVKALINPMIKIGGRIWINNAKLQQYQYSLAVGGNVNLFPGALKTDADGFYRILWVEHTGDNRANTWYSDMICVALDSSFSVPSRTGVGPADEQVMIVP